MIQGVQGGYINNNNIIYLVPYTYLLNPNSKHFKTTIIHESTHTIHFQNNKKLNQYRKKFIKQENNSKNDIKTDNQYLWKSFFEGFACLMDGSSNTRSRHITPLVEEYVNQKISIKTAEKLSVKLDNPYIYGSFIYQNIKNLTNSKKAIEYAFNSNEYTPKSMNKIYFELTKTHKQKYIPYYRLLLNIRNKLKKPIKDII
jgi:hypothetical protein